MVLTQKLLINSSEAASTGILVLRQAQHERIILTVSNSSSVHPEHVEGRTEGFLTASQSRPAGKLRKGRAPLS